MISHPSQHRAARLARPLALASVVLVIAAGCSSGEDEAEAPATDESSEATSPGAVSPPELPEIPRLRQAEGAVADLELGDCATEAGEQSVDGEVANAADEPRDVVVVLSWTNDTSDVLGRGVAVLEDVGPGGSEEFTITAEVADGATQCVPNVQRGEVRGG